MTYCILGFVAYVVVLFTLVSPIFCGCDLDVCFCFMSWFAVPVCFDLGLTWWVCWCYLSVLRFDAFLLSWFG